MRTIVLLVVTIGFVGAAGAQAETSRPLPTAAPTISSPQDANERTRGLQVRTARTNMQALRNQVQTLTSGVALSNVPSRVNLDPCRAGPIGWRACVDRLAAAAVDDDLPASDRESLNTEMADLEAELEALRNTREADTSRFSAGDRTTQQQYNILIQIIRTRHEMQQAGRSMK